MNYTTSNNSNRFIVAKIEALKARTDLLTGLHKVVPTDKQSTISAQQWYAINNQLNAVTNKIHQQITNYTNRYLLHDTDKNVKSNLVNALGEIELELSQAYNFYDTYMDILTQRLSPVLGPLLKGCDIIAADGLKHEYLTEVTRHPIVYCDRGFGASILREGVSISNTKNPVAFIAIPYSRLAEKYNLISIYHEVGHQALNKLKLITPFQQMYALCAKNAGANELLQGMFSNWSKEIIPDFWAFGHTGMGHTSSMRDVLLVPHLMAMNISPYIQHPPSYLRFLISVEWCRYIWGRGIWDEWQDEWESFYPIKNLDTVNKELILKAKQILPKIAKATLTTRFKKINNKTICSLFDFENISPTNISKCKNQKHFNNQAIGTQLAYYRIERDRKNSSIDQLNSIIHSWLININNQSNLNHN